MRNNCYSSSKTNVNLLLAWDGTIHAKRCLLCLEIFPLSWTCRWHWRPIGHQSKQESSAGEHEFLEPRNVSGKNRNDLMCFDFNNRWTERNPRNETRLPLKLLSKSSRLSKCQRNGSSQPCFLPPCWATLQTRPCPCCAASPAWLIPNLRS